MSPGEPLNEGRSLAKREQFFDVVRRGVSLRRACVMGICNVTPDSFSDGGQHFEGDRARAHVDSLLRQGADFIDVGGESTRPGASKISAAEELRRVLPVVRHAVSSGANVSIDTQNPEVAEAALAEGALALNDVSSLADEGLASVVTRFDAAYILMHNRSARRSGATLERAHEEMNDFGDYPRDGYRVTHLDVWREWDARATRAATLGVRRDALVMDPGLGFAKNAEQSREVLAHVGELVSRAAVPVLVGASRKSFLSLCVPEALPNERLGASVAVAIFAVAQGVEILRVHDVQATVQAIAWAANLSTPRAADA